MSLAHRPRNPQRILNFVRLAWWARRYWFPLVYPKNLRSVWVRSDANWLIRLPPISDNGDVNWLMARARPPEDVSDADWQAMCRRAQIAEAEVRRLKGIGR
jgi:hypothetical protein